MNKYLVRCWFTIVLLLPCLALLAQQKDVKPLPGKITGRVIDSATSQNIDYATISVFIDGKETPLTGTTSDSKGLFKVDNLAPGTYTVVVDFIGYNKKTIAHVPITPSTTTYTVGVIFLVKNAAVLQGVTVTSQAKLIENRIDKMVFNAEKDLTSQGGVATDILKKVPQVTVDIDGNVELAGSSSVKFLINGKPSTAFGSNIADVLQSIPASQIKSIEVITNPGAKYDAQGLGGIINIILKNDKTKGINGNLSLTAGTRMENGSLNLNMRNGDFGLNAFASGNARLSSTSHSFFDRSSFDSANNADVLLHQQGSSQFVRHGLESGVGFDWTYKKKNSFSGSLGYDDFGGSGTGYVNQLQTETNAAGMLLSSIASLNNTHNSFNFHSVDANLNYKRTFDKDDQELEVNVNTSFGKSHNIADNEQHSLPLDSLYYGINSVNPGKENETEVTVDYVQPLSKSVKLGFGGKYHGRDISSTSYVLSYQPGPKQFMQDTFLSNSLTYKERVYAAYAELSFPVSSWFDAKIGGRYERTEINAFFSNAQGQNVTPGYNTFVPSIFFMKKLADNQTLKLSVSKRINRPEYFDLNPFINTSDPKNISQGNPYLLPEIGFRYELSYNREIAGVGSFMVSAFYRSSNHDIQPYIYYYPSITIGDTTYQNASVSTRANIGRENNMGFNIFADVHVTKKLSVRSNLFLFYRHTINAIDPGQNSNSYNYRININTSYQFASTLAAEFFGNFNSARREVQGRYPSFTSYSFAIRKQFWNKKGSLALTANNVFGEYINQRTEVTGKNFSTNSVRQVPFRSIGLNFTWKFGKLEFKKDKDDNDNNGGGGGEGGGGR